MLRLIFLSRLLCVLVTLTGNVKGSALPTPPPVPPNPYATGGLTTAAQRSSGEISLVEVEGENEELSFLERLRQPIGLEHNPERGTQYRSFEFTPPDGVERLGNEDDSLTVYLQRLKVLIGEDWKVKSFGNDVENSPQKLKFDIEGYITTPFKFQSLYWITLLFELEKEREGENQTKTLIWLARRIAPILPPVIEDQGVLTDLSVSLAPYIPRSGDSTVEESPISFVEVVDAGHYISTIIANNLGTKPSKYDLPYKATYPLSVLGKFLSIIHGIALSNYLFSRVLENKLY